MPKGNPGQPRPYRIKQFCSNGHDTFVCGRNKWKQCNKCADEAYVPVLVDKRIKQFCKRRHNTSIVGKNKWGQCVQCVTDYHKELYENNKDEILAKNRHWQSEHREIVNISKRKYRKEHPESHRNTSAKQKLKRRLRKVTKFGQEGIKEFYATCPLNKEVDHIIPLINDFVSGLHVQWNLQYLDPIENRKKNNRVDLILASKWYGKLLESEGLK